MKSEWMARGFVLALVGTAVAVVVAGRLLFPPVPLLHARMAETGGWTPENLTAEVGKPLHLRLTSDDVMHGFAIGQIDQPAVDVEPGKVTEVTVTFNKPGKYTFYCTRWCSVNHWRMRGTIEVTGPATETASQEPPLYVRLGMDIDATHQADVPLPAEKPAAKKAEMLNFPIPPALLTQDYYRTHTPVDAYKALKALPAGSRLSDQELWNLVALTWKAQIPPQAVADGKKLYTENCAACHGPGGAGDGVFAPQLAPHATSPAAGMKMGTGTMTQAPTNFTDAAQMLAASPAHLQGKILRGGMGTGMPYWGSVFTEQQTWDLIAYLWSFQFDLSP